MKKSLYFTWLLSAVLAVSFALSLSPAPVAGWEGETFDDGFLAYEVISEADRTARVTGSAVEEPDAIDVPETVWYQTGEDEYIECTVTEIGDFAFEQHTTLRQIRLPETLTTIGWGAFFECRSLETVSFADSGLLSSIGWGAFFGCSSLREITLPDSIRCIEAFAFSECVSLERLVFPAGLAELDTSAVNDCANLREIVLPAGFVFVSTSSNPDLFEGCGKLASITVAEGNPNYYTEDGVLYNVVQEAVLLLRYPPAHPGTSPDEPGKFIVPDVVGAIGAYAFYETNTTTQIVIPESVQFIFGSAFTGWNSLESVTFLSEIPPVFAKSPFGEYSSSREFVIYVPAEECFEPYEKAMQGKPGGKVSFGVIPQTAVHDGSDGAGDPGANPGDGSDGAGDPDTSGAPATSIADSAVPPGALYASTAATPDFRSLQGPLNEAIKAANAAGSGVATLRITNFRSLDFDTLRQIAAAAAAEGKKCEIQADTILFGVVQARLTFNPADALTVNNILLRAAGKSIPMSLAVSLNSVATKRVKALFERFFQNTVTVLDFSQKSYSETPVHAAVKADLSGLNVKSLHFYAYDTAANTYIQISNPRYTIDENGYLCFTVREAGCIVITDKPLQKK